MKRLTVALTGLGLGLVLGACSSTSDYVSDHWPHWAGGLPPGMPPRPGTPGYEDFIAHKQAVPDAGNPAAAAAQPGVQPAPSASAPPSGSAPPADTAPSTDAAVARGGLY